MLSAALLLVDRLEGLKLEEGALTQVLEILLREVAGCLLDLLLAVNQLPAHAHCLVSEGLLFISLALEKFLIVVVPVLKFLLDTAHDLLPLLSKSARLAILVSLLGLLETL